MSDEPFEKPSPAQRAEMELRYDAYQRLVLSLPSGESLVGVAPVRCFPFTAPTEWISFCDESGKELYCLPDLAALPPATRKLLEEDLARREFIPLIRRVYSVSAGAEPTTWHVETDRGETRFVLESEDDLRRLGAHGALIADEHGVRYRILDLRALDGHSRKILNQYL